MTAQPAAGAAPEEGPPLRPAPFLRRGYARDAVDVFLVQVRQAMRSEPPTLAPYEVADMRFPMRRRNAYDARSVDERLDQVTRRLREAHSDDAVARLEGRLPPPPPPSRATWWIYGAALILVAAVAVFVWSRL